MHDITHKVLCLSSWLAMLVVITIRKYLHIDSLTEPCRTKEIICIENHSIE